MFFCGIRSVPARPSHTSHIYVCMYIYTQLFLWNTFSLCMSKLHGCSTTEIASGDYDRQAAVKIVSGMSLFFCMHAQITEAEF
jgi:hypothetical protein